MSVNKENTNDRFKSELKEQLQNHRHTVRKGMFDEIEKSMAIPKVEPAPKRKFKKAIIWISSVAALFTGFMFAAPYAKEIVAELDIPIVSEWMKSDANRKRATDKKESDKEIASETNKETLTLEIPEEIIGENVEENVVDVKNNESKNKITNSLSEKKEQPADKKSREQTSVNSVREESVREKSPKESKVRESNRENNRKKNSAKTSTPNSAETKKEKKDATKTEVAPKTEKEIGKIAETSSARPTEPRTKSVEKPTETMEQTPMADANAVSTDSATQIEADSIPIDIAPLEVEKAVKVKKDYSSWSFALSSKNMIYNGYRKQWGSMELPSIPPATDGVIGWKKDFSHPINISLMVRKRLNKRITLESGLSYTYLWSRETVVNSLTPSTNTNIEIHNIGIPLGLEYNLLHTPKMEIYGKWGVLVEKTDAENQRMGEWQFSSSLGAGISYKFTRRWGLFAEPGVTYYLDNKTSLPTLRNEVPLNFDIVAGIRFYPFAR